jgi:hypothetical protein
MRFECTSVFASAEEEEVFPILGCVADNHGILICKRVHVNLRIRIAIVHVNHLCNEWSIWHVFSAVLVFLC